MKKFLIIIVQAFMFANYGSCQEKIVFQKESELLLRCNILFPDVGYFINVYDNGVFKIAYGGYNPTVDSIVNVASQQEIEISDADLLELQILKQEILEMDECTPSIILQGPWIYEVFVDGKSYIFYLNELLNTPLYELQNKLKSLTPSSFLWKIMLNRY